MSAPQRTSQWKRERAGHITASRMAEVLRMSRPYMQQIIGELMGGVPPEANARPTNWGHEQETKAIAAYELETGLEVRQAGFIVHPELSFVGCSPDGLVGEDGCIEIKAPWSQSRHLRNLVIGMGEEHKPQVQTVMWVCQRDWCDFVSFDPRREPPRDMRRDRIYRDEPYIQRLDLACRRFWELLSSSRPSDEIPDLF